MLFISLDLDDFPSRYWTKPAFREVLAAMDEVMEKKFGGNYEGIPAVLNEGFEGRKWCLLLSRELMEAMESELEVDIAV